MKKVIFILSTVLYFVATQGQSQGCYYLDSYPPYLENCDADTTNLFLPVVFDDTCFDYSLALDCMHNAHIPISDTLFAIAQLYRTDTAISIDGLVFFNWYLHMGNNFTLQSQYDYSTFVCDSLTLYCEILDNNMNPIYHIRYDTINQNVPGTTGKHFSSTTFYALNFDTIITIQGNFYVTISLGKDYNSSVWGKFIEIPTEDISCAEEGKRVYPLLQFNDNPRWYNMQEVNSYKFAAFPIYPRLNTTGYIQGSSRIENIDNEEKSVDVFPNPANSEVNINCGYKMKTLQVFDEQGKRLFEKEVNAYNYQINLENYPTGTYLIKVQTNSGQTTKKVIKE